MKRPGILFLGVLLLSACREPETELPFSPPGSLPEIQAVLRPENPKVGERMQLTVRITADKRLVLPPVNDWLDPSLEVMDSQADLIPNETLWIKEHQLELALFQVTNLTLFAESTVVSLSEPPLEIALPFQAIEVTPTLGEDDTDPKFGEDTLPDFRGPEALKRQKRNLILSAVAGGVLLLIVGLLLWIRSRRPNVLPPPVPPHEIAMAKIRKLTRDAIWQRPDVDACAVALSQILRQYIESRFEIRAPEQTTEEFLEMAEARAPWPEKEQTGLTGFFRAADEIKYAGSRPGREVLENLLTAATAFIESTKQISDKKVAEAPAPPPKSMMPHQPRESGFKVDTKKQLTPKEKMGALLFGILLVALCVGVWLAPEFIDMDPSEFSGKNGRLIAQALNMIWSRPAASIAGVLGFILVAGVLWTKGEKTK